MLLPKCDSFKVGKGVSFFFFFLEVTLDHGGCVWCRCALCECLLCLGILDLSHDNTPSISVKLTVCHSVKQVCMVLFCGVGLRQRIELIQDFSMPVASTNVKVSADGQYIFATGVYKPRVRCYDVHHLSMKFERCIDAETVDMNILSDDYTKVATRIMILE